MNGNENISCLTQYIQTPGNAKVLTCAAIYDEFRILLAALEDNKSRDHTLIVLD